MALGMGDRKANVAIAVAEEARMVYTHLLGIMRSYGHDVTDDINSYPLKKKRKEKRTTIDPAKF
jgi:hypothetical protein